MNNKFEDIYNILKQDKRIVSEDGNILKNKLSTLAMNMDETLLNALISNDITKDLFFKNIDNILVFDKIKFSWIINSKDFLPDSYTAFKNKIMLVDDNGDSIRNSSNVVLSFPFKDCVLEADSTKEKEERNEIFFNETLMKREIDILLAPKVFTNAKRYSLEGTEDITTLNDNDNLVIKGNNLLALHSLIPRYKGKIKCMYWDILYNTDNDQVPYNDSFKHTSWLTMMKNRLEIAKELLKDDGAIFIQCDDNEMAYLKVLCDEIFGRDCCVNTISIEMSPSSGVKRVHKNKKFIKNKEYILFYSKKKGLEIKPLYDEWEKFDKHYSVYFDGFEFSTLSKKIQANFTNYKKISLDKILAFEDLKDFVVNNSNHIYRTHDASKWALENIKSGEILYETNERDIIKVSNPLNPNIYELLITTNNKRNYSRLEPLSWNIIDNKIQTLRGDLWLNFDKDMGNVNKEGGVKLANGKKPERLIKDLITSITDEGDIVLDAFSGSGTTASVCHKMNRKYIAIEQLKSHVEKTVDRLNNVIHKDKTGISNLVNWQGGGSFVCCELKNLAYDFVNKVLASSDEYLNTLYKELKYNEFVTYRVDINKLEENQDGFNSLTDDEKREFLIEIIDKNTLYVNYSEIDDESYNISKEDKEFNNSFYKKEV
ncbi:MAG: site-specific DNA-methyltransferase [Clostridium sp.]|nr:site-specific DNA-methyltransferase [Clostridium sp.]